MFRKLNLYLFAGFIFALQMTVLIAPIVMLALGALTPFTGGEFLLASLPMISGLAGACAFLSCLAAFFIVMTIKLWGIKIERSAEGYWVLSMAAIGVNAWLLLNFQREFVGLYLAIFVLSLIAIILGNKLFQKTMTKLDTLLVE